MSGEKCEDLIKDHEGVTEWENGIDNFIFNISSN